MSKRRRFSPEEKYRIIEEAHQPGVSTAEVCRRHGIAASVFYRWEAQMREGAKEGLADRRGRHERAADAEIERLRAELARKNDVIAELTEALIQEKKGLSDYLRPGGSRRR
jgi:transposase